MRPDETSVQDCGNALDVLVSRPHHVNQSTLKRIIQLLFRSQERVRKQRGQPESCPSNEVGDTAQSRNDEGVKPGPKTPTSTESEHGDDEHPRLHKKHPRVTWGEDSTHVYEVKPPSALSEPTAGSSEAAEPTYIVAAAPTHVVPNMSITDGSHDGEDEQDDAATTSAVNWGNYDSYKYEEKERPFDRTEKHMDYPVRYVADSVRQGNVTMLKALLEEGADVNTRHLGNTILYEACEAGHVECVETLLAAGADIHALNPEGNTNLQINSAMTVTGSAVDENQTALHAVARNVRKNDGVDFLEGPARTSYSWRIMKLLLDSGGDPDALSRNGDTPVSLWFFNVAEPLVLEESVQGLTKVTADHELFWGRDLPNSRTAFELQYHAVHIVSCAMRRRRHRLVQHVNYVSFFLPFELRSQLNEHNQESAYAHDTGYPVNDKSLGKKLRNQKIHFEDQNYHPFGTEPEDDPDMHPWPIPLLDLVGPYGDSVRWTGHEVIVELID